MTGYQLAPGALSFGRLGEENPTLIGRGVIF